MLDHNTKTISGTHYVKLVFLHSVGSMGHIVHFSSPGHETSAHYLSCLGGRVWFVEKARRDTLCQTCVFGSGGMCGSGGAFRCIRGAKRRCTIFHARVALVRIPQKSCQDTLRQTFVFASIVNCGSRSAFQCIRGMKRRRTILHARVGLVRIPQKARWAILRQTCVFASIGIS
jgi:hypothetical protein